MVSSTAGHGFLPNGWIDGSKTTLHAVVMFKCYDGMKFEGASERLVTCNIVPPVSILLFTYPCKLHDFSKQLFCNPLLLERLKSVNLSCKTAVKKNKGKYENGWITKARSTTNFWLSENYFPQNLWS